MRTKLMSPSRQCVFSIYDTSGYYDSPCTLQLSSHQPYKWRRERSICFTDPPFQQVMSKISVRCLFDKEQKRVVFVEAGSNFVDVLFSFLTLPLGSIVRLLGKQTGLGSLDNIYQSVEQLEAKDLQTEACKEMLLNPRSPAAIICEDLKIKGIHDDNPRTIYLCNEDDCLAQSTCYYTYEPKTRCSRCGKQMDMDWTLIISATEKEGVFVEGGTHFIITDDLRVMPVSLMSAFSLLQELRIECASFLEERVVDFCPEEALNLLRSSLVDKRALTKVFFHNACIEPSEEECFSVLKNDTYWSHAERTINIKIILNKKSKEVLYAEVGGDFVNQLLSFLTFPLGSVCRLLGDHIPLKDCISNLYSSAESLGLEFFKSEISKNMVLFPELASYYGCRNQMLKVDEIASLKWTCLESCMKCFRDNYNEPKSYLNAPCKHGLRKTEVIEQNPMLINDGSDSGAGFVKVSKRFMVADNLHISPISAISAVVGTNCPISELFEKEVRIGKAEVMGLLSAMLISETVLTDVFSPKAKLQRRCQYYK